MKHSNITIKIIAVMQIGLGYFVIDFLHQFTNTHLRSLFAFLGMIVLWIGMYLLFAKEE